MPTPPRHTDSELHDLARRMRVLRAEGLSLRVAADALGIDPWTAERLPALPARAGASRAQLVAAAQPWRQDPWSAKDVG